MKTKMRRKKTKMKMMKLKMMMMNYLRKCKKLMKMEMSSKLAETRKRGQYHQRKRSLLHQRKRLIEKRKRRWKSLSLHGP
jgi:hypothetical protein